MSSGGPRSRRCPASGFSLGLYFAAWSGQVKVLLKAYPYGKVTVNRIPQTTFFKNEENRADHQRESNQVVPLQRFLQIHHRKNGKHDEGDHFLYGFQLCRGELV